MNKIRIKAHHEKKRVLKEWNKKTIVMIIMISRLAMIVVLLRTFQKDEQDKLLHSPFKQNRRIYTDSERKLISYSFIVKSDVSFSVLITSHDM